MKAGWNRLRGARKGEKGGDKIVPSEIGVKGEDTIGRLDHNETDHLWARREQTPTSESHEGRFQYDTEKKGGRGKGPPK